ncbi:MAG: hypothetical protein ACE14P_04585 [Methanotrichaceae archaeon]
MIDLHWTNRLQSQNLIVSAWRISIAADVGNKSNSHPHLTPEWVSKIDPDVIIQTEFATKSRMEGFM